MIRVRNYEEADLTAMMNIWNSIVEDGIAYPQMNTLDIEEARAFFAGQTYCAVAEWKEQVVGLYILHPNNVGRCGHIGNTSYGIVKGMRGMGMGRALVEDSIQKAREWGFRILQFNAVVQSNKGAIHLYESLGFQRLGVIPGGFFMKDGSYEDIVLFYLTL